MHPRAGKSRHCAPFWRCFDLRFSISNFVLLPSAVFYTLLQFLLPTALLLLERVFFFHILYVAILTFHFDMRPLTRAFGFGSKGTLFVDTTYNVHVIE